MRECEQERGGVVLDYIEAPVLWVDPRGVLPLVPPPSGPSH